MLPLFFLCLRFVSRDGEENDGIERRGRKKKNKEVWAAYFTSQVFLPLVALVYLLANPVVQDVVLQSGQSSERSAMPAIKNHTKSKDTIYAWDATATIYQESDRLAASPYWPDVLSGDKWKSDQCDPTNRSVWTQVHCGQQSGGVDLQYEELAQRKLPSSWEEIPSFQTLSTF